jgi:hypothetical protein
VRLRDERYLFHLTPLVFFPLWLAAGVALGWLLEDAPFWLRVLIGAPVGWTMPFYMVRMPFFMVRMPFFARMAERRRSGTSR